MKTKWIGYVIGCVAVAMAAPAMAGRVATQPVTIGGDYVLGSMLAARRSADAVQYIGCSMQYNPTQGRYVQCEAQNAQGAHFVCTTANADMMATVAAINAYSYLLIRSSGTSCTSIYTWISSDQLP